MHRLSRIIQKQINKAKFKCKDDKCNAEFTIDDAKKHTSECNRKLRVQCKACDTHIFVTDA